MWSSSQPQSASASKTRPRATVQTDASACCADWSRAGHSMETAAACGGVKWQVHIWARVCGFCVCCVSFPSCPCWAVSCQNCSILSPLQRVNREGASVKMSHSSRLELTVLLPVHRLEEDHLVSCSLILASSSVISAVSLLSPLHLPRVLTFLVSSLLSYNFNLSFFPLSDLFICLCGSSRKLIVSSTRYNHTHTHARTQSYCIQPHVSVVLWRRESDEPSLTELGHAWADSTLWSILDEGLVLCEKILRPKCCSLHLKPSWKALARASGTLIRYIQYRSIQALLSCTHTHTHTETRHDIKSASSDRSDSTKIQKGATLHFCICAIKSDLKNKVQ